MHEQLSKNRVILELDSRDKSTCAVITSSTHDRKSRCTIFSKDNRVYMKHNSLGEKPIPIVVILKAMGVQSDQEIAQLVGSEAEVLHQFLPSLEDAYLLGVFTQQQALKFIGEKVRLKLEANEGSGKLSLLSLPIFYLFLKGYKRVTASPENEAMEILANLVLNHVPVKDYCFRLKVYFFHLF